MSAIAPHDITNSDEDINNIANDSNEDSGNRVVTNDNNENNRNNNNDDEDNNNITNDVANSSDEDNESRVVTNNNNGNDRNNDNNDGTNSRNSMCANCHRIGLQLAACDSTRIKKRRLLKLIIHLNYDHENQSYYLCNQCFQQNLFSLCLFNPTFLSCSLSL